MWPMVIRCSIPRLSKSTKMHSFLSHTRRLLSLLLCLIALKLQLLSMWHPMHMCVWFCLSMHVVETLKNFLNVVLPSGIDTNLSTICSSLAGVQMTKEGSSLSIIQKRFSMVMIGLNFAGGRGVRKDACSTKSASHVTNFLLPIGQGWSTWQCALVGERGKVAALGVPW